MTRLKATSDEIVRCVRWAETFRDSPEIGPHGLHDGTWGEIARTLLAFRDICIEWESIYNILEVDRKETIQSVGSLLSENAHLQLQLNKTIESRERLRRWIVEHGAPAVIDLLDKEYNDNNGEH